ncbi:MAG: hypothetical protein H6745_11565 [Deltaproteobacteria bacterium]|nr:hypothetical protein [Deltaproteobacteria bacterium]
MTRRRGLAALLALTVLAAGDARAASPDAGLARARVCYDALDYDCAERELAVLREALSDAAPRSASRSSRCLPRRRCRPVAGLRRSIISWRS